MKVLILCQGHAGKTNVLTVENISALNYGLLGAFLQQIGGSMILRTLYALFDLSRDSGRGLKVHLETPVHPDSEHVSSRISLNRAKPLEALANEEHVSINTSAGRMGVLRNQIDEHVAPRPVANVDELVLGKEKGQENVDSAFVDEGHGNNKGGLSGLRTQPSPVHHLDQRLESVKKPARDTTVPDAETSYSVGRFGNLPFTSQWGLTDSCRMDNFRSCRDMMLNLFTPADNEFFNEGVRDESAIKRSWKLLCQSA
ncbi:hypothetical protein Tco_0386382 [Tanacetum coccineum]